MTKKSAASLKPVKTPEWADPRKHFDEAKKVVEMTLDAQIKNIDRIDNLVDIWQELCSWGMWDSSLETKFSPAAVDECKKIVDYMKIVYEDIREIVWQIEYDDIASDEWIDPFAKMLPDIKGITGPLDMYYGYTRFRCVRPVGEKFEQIRSIVMSEVGNE